jgi:hypothetical protein
MADVYLNTTQKLTTALKDMHRLENVDRNKKDRDPPAQVVAKAVAVSISSDARKQILNETLK